MENFILSCESTADLPFNYTEERNIPVLFYTYTVNGRTYEDNMMRNPAEISEFYDTLKNGAIPKTSQINSGIYENYFENLLKQGNLLHITFGTGMTNSYCNALLAAEALKQKYPDRKIAVIDSLCSSSGYGMLVDYAADMRDDGKSIDDTAEWVLNNRQKIHHQFYSTDLKYFKKSGRVSGPAAAIATVLSICPLMRLDVDGRITAYDKVRGKQKAQKATVDFMKLHAKDGKSYCGKCYVNHSDCLESAIETVKLVEKEFPKLAGKIKIFNIGTIVASHSGPGTVAVYFLGDER